MDNELLEQMKLIKSKKDNGQDGMAEHSFISSCLQSGFSIQDLKEMEYVDVAKIMINLAAEAGVDIVKFQKRDIETWTKRKKEGMIEG